MQPNQLERTLAIPPANLPRGDLGFYAHRIPGGDRHHRDFDLGVLPSLSRARENANRVACLSNERQLATAFFMYTQDNHGWFPCVAVFGNGLGYGASTPPTGFPADWIGWAEDWIIWRNKQPSDKLAGSIVKYLGNPSSGKIMTCPSDDPSWRKIANGSGYYPYSYAMNSYLSYGTVHNPESGAPDAYGNLLPE